MITLTPYAQQKIGVFGLGKAGEATIASLLAGGAEVFAWDDKLVDASQWPVASKKNADNLSLTTSNYSNWPWAELKALILSPGIPLTHPKPHEVVEFAKRAQCPVIGDIELLYRASPDARYIGITGTNGKSTTTTLIGHILKQAGLPTEIGGNLGTPALALNSLTAEGTYVLELSSYQLDLLQTARFNIGVLLNITPDHLDRHGDMQGYMAAKMHLFDRQHPRDTAIIAIDDDHTWSIASRWDNAAYTSKLIRISAQKELRSGVFVWSGILHDRMDQEERKYDLTGIVTLTGKHNWQNAAAAYAVARTCGVAPDAIYEAMQSFAGLRHRLQLVATINHVRFINDSKATNADATANALAPYDAIYWIAGGKAKAGGITSLAKYFPKIKHAFLIGEAEEEFARTLEGKVPYTSAGTLKAAVKQAADQAFADSEKEGKKDAVVLLSPACASFDQWKSFEERGNAFCAMVEALQMVRK